MIKIYQSKLRENLVLSKYKGVGIPNILVGTSQWDIIIVSKEWQKPGHVIIFSRNGPFGQCR
jgi:hypothetical protein